MIKNAKTKSELAVSALHTLLTTICESPREFAENAELKRALARQSRLGAYSSSRYGVTRTSRSTIERVCERLLDGGPAEFDRLRKQALRELKTVSVILNEEPPPAKRTRDFYRLERDAKAGEVTLGLMDCWHLTSAVFSLISAGRALASECGTAEAEGKWRKEEETVRHRLRMVKRLVVAKGSTVEKWVESIRVM